MQRQNNYRKYFNRILESSETTSENPLRDILEERIVLGKGPSIQQGEYSKNDIVNLAFGRLVKEKNTGAINNFRIQMASLFLRYGEEALETSRPPKEEEVRALVDMGKMITTLFYPLEMETGKEGSDSPTSEIRNQQARKIAKMLWGNLFDMHPPIEKIFESETDEKTLILVYSCLDLWGFLYRSFNGKPVRKNRNIQSRLETLFENLYKLINGVKIRKTWIAYRFATLYFQLLVSLNPRFAAEKALHKTVRITRLVKEEEKLVPFVEKRWAKVLRLVNIELLRNDDLKACFGGILAEPDQLELVSGFSKNKQEDYLFIEALEKLELQEAADQFRENFSRYLWNYDQNIPDWKSQNSNSRKDALIQTKSPSPIHS